MWAVRVRLSAGGRGEGNSERGHCTGAATGRFGGRRLSDEIGRRTSCGVHLNFSSLTYFLCPKYFFVRSFAAFRMLIDEKLNAQN